MSKLANTSQLSLGFKTKNQRPSYQFAGLVIGKREANLLGFQEDLDGTFEELSCSKMNVMQ